MTKLALLLSLLCACEFQHGAASFDEPDARSDMDADAVVAVDATIPVIDADADAAIPPAGTPVTLIENVSTGISSGDSVYCGNSQLARDNAWYRVFRPSDYGASGTLTITRMVFAVEGSKGATVQTTLYAYTGSTGTTLDLSQATVLGNKTGTIPDNATPVVALVSITIPASTVLMLEVKGQDMLNGSGLVTSFFHLGANHAGQTAATYWRSAACGVGTPTSQSGRHAIMWLEGAYQ